MEVTAVLRHARISPQKCRLVADAVRGKPVEIALNTLKFMPKKGASNAATSGSSAALRTSGEPVRGAGENPGSRSAGMLS